MSGMVERVARALDPNCFMRAALQVPYYDYRRQVALDGARAAIEAMREPTDAMVDSGVAFALQASVHGFGGWSNYIAEKHRAMIDAELANASPSPSPGGEVAR